MRYKPEHKKETRRRILETASKEFRAHGFEGVGIAKLMGELNLTHGGFYAHFTDKENLVSESSQFVLEEWLQKMLSAVENGGFPAILDFYLSEEHRDNPELGCILPALSAEMARHSSDSRGAFTLKLSGFFDALAVFMPGASPTEKREKVQVLFCAMTGAVALARAVSDPILSKSLLDSTRESLLRMVAESRFD